MFYFLRQIINQKAFIINTNIIQLALSLMNENKNSK